ncbi:fluoride efflux transporter FluC [Microbacterium indicum]|uniref:fluoride efflux transporter FluC n=1 Tax=Microbacterium indicum TaxID=358100 RepID=UPI00040F4267|nr:CrcB family protein [Microbacterium indicum]
MTPALAVLVAVGGGVGAGLRWLLDAALLAAWKRRGFPWPILVINVTGSFILALLVPWSGEPWGVVLGAGVIGGYTTYSTVSVDTAAMWRSGRRRQAAANVFGTLVLSAAAAAGGIALAGAI